ncbi:T9SS type A sorting domain-containing protein [Bacteroidota bacterium]
MKKHLLIIILSIIISPIFAQWGLTTAPSMNIPPYSLVPFNGNMLASTGGGIYSTSDGMSWTDLTNGFGLESGNAWRQIVIAGTDIYAGSTLKAVIKSSDNGSTWSYDTTGLETGGFGANEIDALHYDMISNHILASKGWPGYGLFYKKPNDASWTRVNSNNVGSSTATVYGMLNVGAGIGSAIFAATSGGFFISIDGGVTWTQKTGANLPLNILGGSYTGKILVTDGTNIYCATGAGVYKSSDQGDNWTRIDQGFAIFLTGLEPNVCSINYQNGTLYAGVIVNGGIDSAYSSVDGGMTWTDMSEGLMSQVVSFLEFGGSLYAVQFGQDTILKWGGGIPQSIEHNENYSESIQVFPNPADDYVTVQFNNSGGLENQVQIVDIEGRIILYFEGIKHDHFKIDIQNLKAGIYFIETRNSRNSHISKFIKQ